MVIQRILFPQIHKCTEQELYFRAAGGYCGAVQTGNGGGTCSAGEVIFGTWRGTGCPGSSRAGSCGMALCPLDAGSGNRKDGFAGNVSGNACGCQEPCGVWGKTVYHYSEGFLRLKAGMPAGFDTYFNGFSVDKWKKYTMLDQLYVRLVLSGKVKVTLYARQKLHERVMTKIMSETIVEASVRQAFDFAFDWDSARGMLAFELEALDGDGAFYGGAYRSRTARGKMRDVTLGAGICTFHREAFVKKNLRVLLDEIINQKDSVLYGHLEVFISDNGRSLDAAEAADGHLHLYPNRNVGGAGGFTRCLLEMKKSAAQTGVTHALLMDDDIVIEPQVLERTYMLLALRKEACQDLCVGGAMLRLDEQAVQFEAGAVWHADTGMMHPLKSGLDLRSCENCLDNEMEEYANYNAWWYCCFPLAAASDDNLPLPLFIKMDDVEYGVRNIKHLVLMNGICVWHEPFEHKYASSLEYYNVRNRLVNCALHSNAYHALTLQRQMLAFCLREITYYRYQNVDLYLRGIRDFLKGPRWLMRQDAEKLHQELMEAGYQAKELEALDMGFDWRVYETSRGDYGQYSSRRKRILTLNGLLLPAKGDNIAPMASVRGVHFYRRKRVMNYDITSNRAFLTERSVVQMLRSLLQVARMLPMIGRGFEPARRAYQAEGKRLMQKQFWERYLRMNQNNRTGK